MQAEIAAAVARAKARRAGRAADAIDNDKNGAP
jgi:hypothetical protein